MVILLFTIFYILLVIDFTYHLLKKEKKEEGHLDRKNTFSLVVSFRNEEKRLPILLDSIRKQKRKIDKVIFIDDGSDDETLTKLRLFAIKNSEVKVISTPGIGKKAALFKGVNAADTDYVIFTDADCYLNENYFDSVYNYLQKNEADLLFGGVDYFDKNSILSSIERLEFNVLQAITLATFKKSKPIMCNGANMVVKREKYLEQYKNINKSIASGDDLFLLHAFKRANYKIEYIDNQDNIVNTQPCNTLKEILIQRGRWASKNGKYSDKYISFVTLILALGNFYWFGFLFGPKTCIAAFILFVIKYLTDFTFMFVFLKKRNILFLIKYSLILEVIYLPYLISVFIASLLYKNRINWK